MTLKLHRQPGENGGNWQLWLAYTGLGEPIAYGTYVRGEFRACPLPATVIMEER